jgi:hypothetical protein
VRLIEKRAGLAPRALLVTPIREFQWNDRKRVGTDLRIAQQLNSAAGALQDILQILLTHGDSRLLVPWTITAQAEARALPV